MALVAMLPKVGMFRVAGALAYSSFRSSYNLDKLYPEGVPHTVEEDTQQCSHIPVERLTISYSKSGGPGGQNVNKVNTKAEVRFQLLSADWIPESTRQKISVLNKNRINRSGELVITSEVSRYQMRNLADCLDKLRAMISEASHRPEPPAKEDIELWKRRIENENRERLRQKKIHSATKQSRHVMVD